MSSNWQFIGFFEGANIFLPHLTTTTSTVNKHLATPSSTEYNLQVNKTKSSSYVKDSNIGVDHLWHQSLGHPYNKIVILVLNELSIKSKLQNELSFCFVCLLGKTKQFPFSITVNKTQTLFELVLSNVWGLAHTTSCDGYKYYIAFVDVFIKYSWVYPMQQNSQTTLIVLQFIALVDLQFPIKLKCLQTNQGGEFHSLQSLLQKRDFLFHHLYSHIHQQNGKVE